MPRRHPGTLLPIEVSILETAVHCGAGEFHGFEIAKSLQASTGARLLTAHGTLYKALGRLESAGLLSSRWEDPAPEGRPRRRLYTVTGAGERALVTVHREAPRAQTRPGLAT